MVSLPLLDVVLSTDDGTTRSAKVAAELIQSALGEFRHIENLDESLASADASKFERQTVALIRGMYEEWTRGVEALLDRIGRLERRTGAIVDAEALRDAHGRTRAMLAIPLDRLESDHQLAGRQGRPIGEVRRELRLGAH